jgi:hypothetical protein
VTLISPDEHRRLVALFQNVINAEGSFSVSPITEEQKMQLSSDIQHLDAIAKTYLHTKSQLPELSREYQVLLRKLRITVRKLQMKRIVEAKKR